MNGQVSHQELASGRWRTLSLLEQMANIGSEVGRAINAREQKNEARALAAGRIRAIYAEAGFSGRETAAFLLALGYSVWGIRADGRLVSWRDTGQWDNALFLAPGHPAIPR